MSNDSGRSMVDARCFIDHATAPLFVGTVKLCNAIFYFRDLLAKCSSAEIQVHILIL